MKRITFAETLENARKPAAESAWNRASIASSLRKCLNNTRNFRAQLVLGILKKEALRIAVNLNPEEIIVGIDGDYQIGMLSVRWKGHGRYHLPMKYSEEFPSKLNYEEILGKLRK